MKRKKETLTDEEREELDNYLQDEFYYDIVQELATEKDEWYFELFKPLEFLRLFHTQVLFIKENKNRLSRIAENLESSDLSGDEFYYLFDKLLDYFSEFRKKDKQLNICCREIERLKENLDDDSEADDLPEEKELTDYVKNGFDVAIVEDIENNPDLIGFIEPLEFIQLLEETKGFIHQNEKNPLAIKKRLKQEFPNRLYFLKCLEGRLQRYINGYDIGGSQDIALHQIFMDVGGYGWRLLQQAVEIIHDERVVSGDFEAVKERADEISNKADKITFLEKIKTDCKQDDFKEKCDAEIERLKQQIQIETSLKETTNDIKKHKDLTLDRAALFFNYLFTYAKANCHNTEKSKVISFLTSYSEKTIRQKLSNPHSKDNEKSFLTYKTDLEIVRKCFESLGLSEIVSQINRDLEN